MMSSRSSSRYVSPVDPSLLDASFLPRFSSTSEGRRHPIKKQLPRNALIPNPVHHNNDISALTSKLFSRVILGDDTTSQRSFSRLETGNADVQQTNSYAYGEDIAKPQLDISNVCALSPGAVPKGRNSPCHDLGYHTLITPRQDVPPTPISMLMSSSSPLPWPSTATSADSDSPPFSTPVPTWSVPQMSLAPPPPLPPNTKQVTPTTFKGKRLPRSAFFDRLADDLILRIFSFLSTNDVCVCARVCRRWYFLAWEPQLWTYIALTGERTNADKALKALVRLLCRHTNSHCLTVEKLILNGCSKLTNRGLSIIAKKCPELRTVELRACAKVSDLGVHELVASCNNLEKLDISGCPSVKSLQAMGKGVENRQLYVQFLDMTDCHLLQDSHVKTIVQSCPQLTHLYLRRCVQLTDASLKYAASYCIMLREFSMSDCVQLTDFGLYELAKLGSNLRYLSVAKCDQISDAGVKHIARQCYKLRYLNVRGCEAVSDDSMGVIARSCPRLRSLDVGKCDVSDHGLKLLSEHCPNIRKLSVKSCDAISDQGIQFIAYYCRGLQQLNIQDCHVTIDGYRTVKKYCKKCIIEHTNPGFY